MAFSRRETILNHHATDEDMKEAPEDSVNDDELPGITKEGGRIIGLENLPA